MVEEFEKKKNLIDAELISASKKYGIVSFFRLVSFFGAVILIYMGATGGGSLLGITGVIMAAVFILLLRLHARLDERRTCLNAEKKVTEGYIARLNGEWRSFEDDGSEFLADDDMLSRDIDLLGRNSLYQYISVAHTEDGRRKTALAVSLKNIDPEKIKSRNEAVNELAGKKDFLISFESVTARIAGRKKRKDIKEIDEKKESLPFIVPVMMLLIPLINIAVTVLALTGTIDVRFILLSIFACLIITELFSGIRNRFLYPIHILGNSSRDYYALLQLLKNEEFKSSILKGIRE